MAYNYYFCYYYIIFRKHHVFLWNFLWNLHYDFTCGRFLWLFHFASEAIYSASLRYGSVHIVSRIHRGCVCSVSHIQLSATPLAALHQAPLSVEFSGQEHWRGLPFPSSRDVSDPRIESTSLASSVLAGKFSTDAPPGKPLHTQYFNLINCDYLNSFACLFFSVNIYSIPYYHWTLF